MTTTEHFTAWITTDTSALPGENIDLTVLADEISGYRDENETEPVWQSTGDPLLHAETETSASEGDPADALRQAETILRESGWSLAGKWNAVDSGFTVTVERA